MRPIYTRYWFTHAYLAENSFTENGQVDDRQGEDDQTKDTADDSPEVEGSERFESVQDSGAGHVEAKSSGEYTAGADSSVEDVRGVSVKNGQAIPNMREREAYLAADLLWNVLFNDPYIHIIAEAYGFPEDKRIAIVEKNGFRCLSFYVTAVFLRTG
ncbi:hypothetical protein EC957_008160 [Mortierella hygrophila]|uniref:Uncharacterized protein n=1 Tax=Mortierella hygrophila TaxID=979708 RepID=A0A9P6K858_9FUNG|nr:hypothetical protein EC957_008160 [Mortierella hygrophila]